MEVRDGRNMKDLLNDILEPELIAVWRATKADKQVVSAVAFVETFRDWWAGDFLHPFGDNLHRADRLNNSVLYAHLAAQTRVFRWLGVTLLCGEYDVIMRELRTILEVMFPTFYLDVEHSDENLESKLSLLQQIEEDHAGYGKRAFELSGFAEWPRYYELYRQLCRYEHLSLSVTGRDVQVIAEAGFPESRESKYDRASLQACVTIWHQVARLAVEFATLMMERLAVPCDDALAAPPEPTE